MNNFSISTKAMDVNLVNMSDVSYTISAILTPEPKEVALMYQIKYVFGHYNVYAPSGRFLFSADTESEAWEELEAMEA